MRKPYRGILLILSLSLLLALGCASALADSSYTIANNGSWSGTLTNLNMSQAYFTTHASLDWDHPIWSAPFPVSFIRIPAIKAGIELKLGASGEFDVTISQANLNENQNIDSTIRYSEQDILIPGKEMYRERIDKGISLTTCRQGWPTASARRRASISWRPPRIRSGPRAVFHITISWSCPSRTGSRPGPNRTSHIPPSNR